MSGSLTLISDALRLVVQHSISDGRDCRRIFLGSVHDETRREVSPWFTRIDQSPGDLTTFVAAIVRKYAALSKQLSEDAASRERVRYYQSLLQRELHYSWTVDRAKQVIVDEAFATLSFATRSGPLRFPIASQSESGDDVGWAGLKTRADLLAELTTRRTTILAGEAGSGKTTLLKSIVRELARQPDPTLLPIFLGAHELTNVRISTFRSILDSLAERNGVSGLSTALLESMKSRACLLVVDGLDELGRDRLNELLELLRTSWSEFPQLRVLMSCRWHSLADLARSEADLIVRLHPLTDHQIRRFLELWLESPERARQLDEKITEIPELRVLAGRPLLLSMLAYLWGSASSSPLSVTTLYDDAIRLLLGKWDWQRGIFRENKFSPSRKINVLVLCAVEALTTDRHVLSTESLARALTSAVADEGLSASEADLILYEIEEQTGLLTEIAPDRWAFAHTCFRDYFCSRFVVQQPFKRVVDTIRRSPNALGWLPVLQLAAASLNAADAHGLLESIFSQVQSLGSIEATSRTADKQRDITVEPQKVMRKRAAKRNAKRPA